MKIHIVQKGDTLWKIAQKYGVDFEELKQLNSQLSNPDMIMPGMKVKVPSTGVQVKAKEAPFSPSQLVKEKPVKEAPKAQVQPIKEAPVQPVKEAPVKPVKEAPVAPIQEVEEPFVDLSPEPLPVVEGVQEVPKAPTLPYAPKLPQLPQFEMDINNYYLNVDANFLKGAPMKQPQPPTAVSPATDQPKTPAAPIEAPKAPVAPQVSPVESVEEECVPITGINPGYGFNFNPYGPPPGFMQPQQGFMPQPGYPSMVSPVSDDELDDMPEMPPYPGANPLSQQMPMTGGIPYPQQMPMAGGIPYPQQMPVAGGIPYPQQMPMTGGIPYPQQMPMTGGNPYPQQMPMGGGDCGCGGPHMQFGPPFGEPGYAAPQSPWTGGVPGYGTPAFPSVPSAQDLDDQAMPWFGQQQAMQPGYGLPGMAPGFQQIGMQPDYMPQGLPQGYGMPELPTQASEVPNVPQGFAPGAAMQPWGAGYPVGAPQAGYGIPSLSGQQFAPGFGQQPVQPGFATGYPGVVPQQGFGMPGYPAQGPLGMPDFDDDDDFNL